MCGIICTISCSTPPTSQHVENDVHQLLRNRGPDAFGVQVFEQLTLAGYVLWQQGNADTPTQQPINAGDITLLFNGDLFNVEERTGGECSDSAWLAEQLAKCSTDAQLLSVLRDLEGPYSLICYDRRRNCVYFARDALGRVSLLMERVGDTLRLCSTTINGGKHAKICQELPPLGLYQLQLAECANNLLLHPWTTTTDNKTCNQLVKFCDAFGLTAVLAECIELTWLQTPIESLSAASFDFYGLSAPVELESPERVITHLLRVPAVQARLYELHELLSASVRARVRQTRSHCQRCLPERRSCTHAKLSILFSGGIDCSILALHAHQQLHPDEPIELINVAFEQPTAAVQPTDWRVPDRLTALAAHAELQQLCPTRVWQLHEVNVSREELADALSTHIKHLVYPLTTVLDESLGAAFWFAARGQCTSSKSTARVVLVGSGADELFAGYTRHRNAYRRCVDGSSHAVRLQALHNELESDWQRLPSRNLARDDRVIGDNGKTVRAPFIEEHFVRFVRGLSPAERCCFNLPVGLGDKLLLRLHGYQLGLRMPATLKKRAIQFGSRVANKKQNAQDQSAYLVPNC